MNGSLQEQQRRRRQRTGGGGGGSFSTATKLMTTAVVAYGAYRFVDWAWNAWWGSSEDNHDEESTTRAVAAPRASRSASPRLPRSSSNTDLKRKRTLRFQRCHREWKQAWLALGSASTLLKPIEDFTDVTDATKRLRVLRQEQGGDTKKLEEEQQMLWETIKVQALTRLISTAYAQTLLLLVLQTQVHLWGSRLWNEKVQNTASTNNAMTAEISLADDAASSATAASRMSTYQQEHQHVLQSTFGYFFETGLEGLVNNVRSAVESVWADWNVLDEHYLHVDPIQFQQAIATTRLYLEKDPAESTSAAHLSCPLWQFFVPAGGATTSSTAVNATKPNAAPMDLQSAGGGADILAETWDWLESPLLNEALMESLQVTFGYLEHSCWEPIFQSTPSISLAQLLPKLKKAPPQILAAGPNHVLLTEIKRLATVQEIAHLCFAS